MLRFKLILVGAVLALPGLQTPEARGADPENNHWSQWRGPQRDGFVADAPRWPASLTGAALEALWRIPLGPSYSGPLIVDDRVYVTETRDQKEEVVRALDRKTGKELWSTSWQGALSVPFFAKANGDWIRATPAWDAGLLFVAGMRDVLVCLDAETGRELWRKDFVAELGSDLPAFGFVSSPLIDGDYCYVQAGGGFVKLEKATGNIVWRTLQDTSGSYDSAFSSPVIAEVAGRRQAVVQTRQQLAGVDLESGEPLWSVEVPAFRGMNILTPTVIGDRIFTSSYGGGSFLFRVEDTGDGMTVKTEWRNKVQGYMSSPIVIDGHVYVHLRNKRFACINLESGEETWITTPYGSYWSMVAQGDRILALDERGDLLLIRANPTEFELIDSRHVSDESTWAHVAVLNGDVYVRSLNDLQLFRWSAE